MAKGIGAMDHYWTAFWQQHAQATRHDHPQRQVLRTLDKRPVSDQQFQQIVEYVGKTLNLAPTDEVLDLCCGNGLLTMALAPNCKSILGVDCAEDLVAQIDLAQHANLSVLVEDVRTVRLKDQAFDKILMYAGLQYFSHKDTVLLFEKAIGWLKPAGRFFIGDIPDRERIWRFFDSDERARICFNSIKSDKPIVGTWFEGIWLEKLAGYTGFAAAQVLQQPAQLPFAHYRFDMCLKKAAANRPASRVAGGE